jgi:hypothetical protein
MVPGTVLNDMLCDCFDEFTSKEERERCRGGTVSAELADEYAQFKQTHTGKARVLIGLLEQPLREVEKKLVDEVAAHEAALTNKDTEHENALRALNCSGATPVLENGACRARVQSDCTNTPVLENGVCRALRVEDCDDDTHKQIFENGVCRARRQSDCTDTANPVLGTDGACRAPSSASECPSDKPIWDSGACRAPSSASECPSDKPVFDAIRWDIGLGACRAPSSSSECPSDKANVPGVTWKAGTRRMVMQYLPDGNAEETRVFRLNPTNAERDKDFLPLCVVST